MIASAREFTSAAEMRSAAAAVHARLFNPVVRKQESVVIEAASAFVTRKVPLWLVKDIHFDAHLVEWYDRAANRPLTYLKDRCRELGIPYRKIIGSGRKREIVGVRQELIWEVHNRFGTSFPALGRMFGGRDHTTILHSVRRVEAKRRDAA